MSTIDEKSLYNQEVIHASQKLESISKYRY